MPELLSANLNFLKASETVAISAACKARRAAGEDVFDLSIGEPDFDTPAVVAEAGIEAIRKGYTKYPPNIGTLELRSAIATNLSLLSGGRPVNADRIIVSSGSKQAIFNACFSLFGPQDKVLIPGPAWVSYPQIVHLARATPVPVPGDPEWGLKVGVQDLQKKYDKLVRGLILCSPCNPTGAVYTLAELKAIAQWAHERQVWIIADEIYRRIHYGPGPAPSFLDLPDELLERVVVVTGASKAYAMTGWRIGCALVPAHLHKAMAALQSHTTTGANHPAMVAATTAYADPRVEQDVLRMVEGFRRRRDTVVERFRREAPGVEFVEPLGAFYFFFRVDGLATGAISGGQAFCDALMAEEGVALVPGAAFGDDRWVRMSYAVSDKELGLALDRVLRFIAKLTAQHAA
ncbi:MAG TPA: pyridoxal phosphate-dependent aminotransferase [Gemmatimonadales bacterium]|jgi:aspartate/methionine/tyrosine aminotransferase|nr:pyridoxal phosphate-dependent aminotransferase [Gemmatimonadales bacterium]